MAATATRSFLGCGLTTQMHLRQARVCRNLRLPRSLCSRQSAWKDSGPLPAPLSRMCSLTATFRQLSRDSSVWHQAGGTGQAASKVCHHQGSVLVIGGLPGLLAQCPLPASLFLQTSPSKPQRKMPTQFLYCPVQRRLLEIGHRSGRRGGKQKDHGMGLPGVTSMGLGSS